MADQTKGANNSGTDSAIGTIDWTDKDQIFASDDSYASAVDIPPAEISYYLIAIDFGFTLPVDAIIKGIEVDYEVSASKPDVIKDYECRIIKNNTITGSNLPDSNYWPDVDDVIKHGGANELWDEIWVYDDINSDQFGCAIAVINDDTDKRTAYIDYVEITVTYIEVGGTLGMMTCRSKWWGDV